MKILLFSKETPLLAKNALAEIAPTQFIQDPESLLKNISAPLLLVFHGLAGQEVLAKLKSSISLISHPLLKILALADESTQPWENWFIHGADSVLPYPCHPNIIQHQARSLLGFLDQLESRDRKISALEWYKSEHHRGLRTEHALESAITSFCATKSLGIVPSNLHLSFRKDDFFQISSLWGNDPATNHPFLLLIHPITGSPLELLYQEILISHLPAELSASKPMAQILENWNSQFLKDPSDVPNLINISLLQWGSGTLTITQAGQQYCGFFDGKDLTTIPSDCAPLGVPGIRIWEKEMPWHKDCKILLGFANGMPPGSSDLYHQILQGFLNNPCELLLEQWQKSIPASETTSAGFLAIASKNPS